jgi:hypothetical protein
MTEKEYHISSLVQKIVSKEHDEELHQMFLDYLEDKDETESSRKWDKYIKEVETKIGMKLRLKETEDYKDLLITKLEQELML